MNRATAAICSKDICYFGFDDGLILSVDLNVKLPEQPVKSFMKVFSEKKIPLLGPKRWHGLPSDGNINSL